MNPIVQKLIVKRFRSIPTDQVDFDNPTFVVGRNGSGKSNFVDAFALLAEITNNPLQAVFDKRGGITAVRNKTSGQSYPPNLGLGVVFGPINGNILGGRYAFEVKALPNHGFKVVREQCVVRYAKTVFRFDRDEKRVHFNFDGLSPSVEASSLILPVVGGDSRFAPVLKTLSAMRVYSIQPGKIREMQDPDSGTVLRPDGSNTASILQELERSAPADLTRVCELLATIVPNTRKVRATKHGNKLSMEFTQEWGEKKKLKFESFNMSDGTLRALGLLIAVYQSSRPSVIVIEEPESTIHPGALGAILDLMRHASRFMQVIVTTHSPELLDAKWIEAKNLRIALWEQGATRIGGISEASRKALAEHLIGAGELLRSNALEAEPLFQDSEFEQGLLFEDTK